MKDIALELTADERRVVAALKRIAKRWPQSIWLYAAGGDLHVMRADEDGGHHYGGSGGRNAIDPAYALDVVRIPSDGGDW